MYDLDGDDKMTKEELLAVLMRTIQEADVDKVGSLCR